MNGTTGGAPKLLYPGLAGFYATFTDIAYTLIRVVVGVMFFMHVWGKYNVGPQAVATRIMAGNGLEPALLFAYTVIALETVGCVTLILGIFTRFVGAVLAVEMLIALIAVHLPKGYAVGAQGYEYVLLIGACLFLIAVRGGGPYSVDRLIGKEL
jgi:putative oxidoreductase